MTPTTSREETLGNEDNKNNNIILKTNNAVWTMMEGSKLFLPMKRRSIVSFLTRFFIISYVLFGSINLSYAFLPRHYYYSSHPKHQKQHQQKQQRQKHRTLLRSLFPEPINGEKSKIDSTTETTTTTTISNNLVNGSDSKIVGTVPILADPICRIVALSDASLPSQNVENTELLDKLDSLYNAKLYQNSRDIFQRCGPIWGNDQLPPTSKCRKDVINFLRSSLEDAGFQLVTKRDVELCEALNAGYLLRLSIIPDLSGLDSKLTKEFYPNDANSMNPNGLFDDKILVFWRGYSQEITKGKLLVPKLDYLQATLVQSAAAWIKSRLDFLETETAIQVIKNFRRVRAVGQNAVNKVLNRTKESILQSDIYDNVTAATLINVTNNVLPDGIGMDELDKVKNNGNKVEEDYLKISEKDISSWLKPFQSSVKLERYGGSKVKFVAGSADPTDALRPFMLCEINYKDDGDEQFYKHMNAQKITCSYDSSNMMMQSEGGSVGREPPKNLQLLQRVSISSLVDIFTASGRKTLFKTIFEDSELVEPTYKQIVVIWQPKSKDADRKPIKITPKFISEFADMFDINLFGRNATKRKEDEIPPPPIPLQIRTFDDVPMANLPAVLPKSKLVFRPADALLFDLISIATLGLVLGSIRLDNPKLDLIALISVIVWVVRTILRYSNKLARYDLLVKTFLTSRISRRNSGSFKYLAAEAGSQRAVRAVLTYNWLLHKIQQSRDNVNDKMRDSSLLSRDEVIQECNNGVNDLFFSRENRRVEINVDAALQDLLDLNLISYQGSNRELMKVQQDEENAIASIKNVWNGLFSNRSNVVKFNVDENQ